MISNEELIEHLKAAKILKSPRLEAALRKVDRMNFVPDELKPDAYIDHALPLFDGQTISQPLTVVFMLEQLDVQEGNKVLDIGAGSAWVSCLFGELVGESGKVFAYELNENVGDFGEKNIKKYDYNIEYKISNAAKEWDKNKPYDRIYSAAAFTRIPPELTKMLAPEGILVAPTTDGFLRKITPTSEEKVYGFAFVPFVDD